METTTTLRFKSEAADLIEHLAEEIETALIAEISGHGLPIVTAYFVHPCGTSVQIGLRFEQIDPENVEAVTAQLVQGALEKVNASKDADSRGKQTSTLLVGV